MQPLALHTLNKKRIKNLCMHNTAKDNFIDAVISITKKKYEIKLFHIN
ncbi:hypothetical protein SAMN05216325_1181 [Nitrosomonas marina]|uniref:Uncharacterized protein n=1 Tax=Nitrosomonas marina TaxID=917 RepID=A0A1H8GFQ3_9PROT|nr:hypothetical protein SAMN05216325_1181 [Nitrosomonas marina]